MLNIVEIIITILIFNAIIGITGGLIFFIACLKQHEFFPYLFVYVFFSIATVIYIFQFLGDIYLFLAILFYDFTAISIFIASLIDYYKIRIRTKKINVLIEQSTLAVVMVNIVLFSMQVFMILIVIISAIILLKIYLTTKEINKLLVLICVIIATSGSAIQTFLTLEGLDALFLDSLITTVWITIYLVNGIVVLLEIEINKNLKTKDNLKDVYSHNVGNTLHSILLTYELIKSKIDSKNVTPELFDLLEKNLYEASKLVKEIRKL
jgi:hypothetical protein